MKPIKRVAVCLSLIMVAAAAQPADISADLGTFTAAAVGTGHSLPWSANKHTVSFVTAGSPSGCTMNLEGSIDGTNYFDMSGNQTCTSSTAFAVVNIPVTYVRAHVTVLSGGTAPTVAVRYLGVQ